MKTVLITGASRGLGSAIAEVFAKHNYNIIINYNKSYDEAIKLQSRLKQKYNVNVEVIKADVTLEEEVKEMFLKIDYIDVLVNNAGIALDNTLEEKGSEEFMQVIRVNLLGTYLVTKYAIQHIKKGAIINIASTNGIDTPYIESIDYDASKAGVISLTHNFAKYLAPNIRVNAVAPGWIDTSMTKELEQNFKIREINKIGLKRFAKTDEIAGVVCFLASDEASYINDTIVRVDGGKSA